MGKTDKRILLFEREKAFAAKIEKILKAEGYEVETPGSLREAQQKATQHDFNVLMVGRSAADEWGSGGLQKINSNLRKILISGKPDISDIFIFPNAGFDDYVAITSDPIRSYEAENLMRVVRGAEGRKTERFLSGRREERVLVFDGDSKTDLEKVFAGAGFRDISRTEDLKKALEIIEAKTPDIVVADFTLPHTVSLLKEARTRPEVRILLTSEAHVDLPSENLFWYFDYFMVKPVRKNDIAAATAFLLEEESCFRLPLIRPRRPDEEGVNFYLVGPYGAGKSTVARLLSDPDVIGPFRNLMPTLTPYPRFITRELWPKEKEGVDYYSVPEATFDDLCRRGNEIDWKSVDYGKKLDGIREFYPLEGIRVSADVPLPIGKDFLIAPAIKGFEKMAPNDRRAHPIFFGISFETMRKRQLDRPESDRDKRTPKTLEAYKKYMALFDPYVPGQTPDGTSNQGPKYGLMVINENGNNPQAQQENELNRMRKMAVRLAWYIKYVREGK